MRFVLWAAPTLVAGCTVIAGLDGDYVMGASVSSSAESAAASGGATTVASSGGANEAGSGTVGGASTTASAGGTGGAGGYAPVSCDDQYDGAPEYQLCSEDATSCSFDTETQNATSCEEICLDFGGECLQAFDNSDCSTGREIQCNDNSFQTTLCVCSKGCGAGPPCMGSLICESGSCN